jgi:hypothetical protein
LIDYARWIFVRALVFSGSMRTQSFP